MAISAKYAGVCSRTGRKYGAGALIVKGPNGWELASQASARLVSCRTPEGKIIQKRIDGSAGLYHRACVEAGNIEMSSLIGADDPRIQFARYEKTGTDFACRNCGGILHVLSEDEEWQVSILPTLHITASGSLSAKLPDQQWESVKRYFRFVDYAALAEAEDDMDNFETAEHYERLARYSKGEYRIMDDAHIPTVEATLGILTENTYSVRRSKEAEEQHRADETARAERDSKAALLNAKAQLFNTEIGEIIVPENGRVEGDRIRWEGGFNIYGGGQEFAVADNFVWLIVNNGGDGDDWSRNNIATGGAGAIGYRFPLTPERLAFLRQLPGAEYLYMTDSEKQSKLLGILGERKAAKLEGWWNGRLGAPITFDTETKTITLYVKGQRIETDLSITRLFVRLPYELEDNDIKYTMSGYNDRGVMAEYPLTANIKAEIIALIPEWVGTSRLGRYLVPAHSGHTIYACQDAADALRLASSLGTPLNSVTAKLGVEVVAIDKDRKTVIWSDDEVSVLSGGCSLRERNSNRFTNEANNAEYRAAGFPELPEITEPIAQISDSAFRLIRQSLITNKNADWRQYLTVTTTEEKVAENWENDHGNWGKAASLVQVNAIHTDGKLSTYWLVKTTCWSMGEDADVLDTAKLYMDKESAQAEYNSEKS